MVLLLLIGSLVFFRPFLTTPQQVTAETPDAQPLFSLTEFRVAPKQQACQSSVTITSKSALAFFGLRPAKPSPKGGPPVELTVTAPGYRGSLLVPGGYPGGTVTLPISPPVHDKIGTACFLNRGTNAVLLLGTTEGRTVSRSSLVVNGRPTAGDISLTFFEAKPQSLIGRLGQIFQHTSNLLDGLLPPGAIWVLAVLIAFGIPAALVASVYKALREDADRGV